MRKRLSKCVSLTIDRRHVQMYPSSHPVTHGIGSSPHTYLNWISSLENGWKIKQFLFLQDSLHAQCNG